MGVSGSEVAPALWKAVWKFVSTTPGVLSVMTFGEVLMLQSCVLSWVSHVLEVLVISV